MFQGHYFTAILLLGGIGARFGGDKPKQFQLLSGKKVYLHTLEKFLKLGFFDEILLVAALEYHDEVKQDVKDYPSVRVIQGGRTRQESSFKGLLHCNQKTEYVVIQDAVRPFISKNILLNNLKDVLQHGAVNTCCPSYDTIVESFDGGVINRIPQRSHYLRGQTPQSFKYNIILEAHQSAIEKQLTDISDDCRLVLENHQPVHIVKGEELNIKITTELDLFMAEQLMRLKNDSLSSVNQDNLTLKDRKYVVIGGTGGIGQAIVELLKTHQAIPISLSRNSQPYSMDISNDEEIQQVFSLLEKDHGPVDGLINCAGQLKIKELKDLSFEEIRELLEVNLHGVINSCKSCSIKPGGHVVNIASSSFTRGRKNYSVYSCAKAAVVNFTQALAEEHPHLNINAVIPQRTLTPMRKENFPEEDESTLLTPHEVAKTIINLLMQESITGQMIEVRKQP